MPARQAIAALPLLAVATMLLGTGVDFHPAGAIVGAGPIQLTLERLIIIAGLAALIYCEGLDRRLFRTGLAIPLALLLAVGLVASLRWQTGAAYRFLFETVALFYLTVGVVRSRADAGPALATVALVAVGLSTLSGLAQISQHEATGFYRAGCVPVTDVASAAPPGTITRATGTFENPNLLAAHVLLLAPLGAVAVAASAWALQLRLALGLVVALGYLGLGLTYSRVAVFTALVGLGVAFATSRLKHRAALAAIGVMLALGSTLLFATCGSEAVAGFGRAAVWREAVEVIKDQPLTGVGLGRLGDVLHAHDARAMSPHGHNLLLNWAAEAGLLAAAAWLWILASLLWRSARSALAGNGLARGALVALIGFSGVSMLDHPANLNRIAIAFWIVAGIAAAATSRAGSQSAAAASQSETPQSETPQSETPQSETPPAGTSEAGTFG